MMTAICMISCVIDLWYISISGFECGKYVISLRMGDTLEEA